MNNNQVDDQIKETQILTHSERFAQRCQELLDPHSLAAKKVLPFVAKHDLQTKGVGKSSVCSTQAQAMAVPSGKKPSLGRLHLKHIMARLKRFL